MDFNFEIIMHPIIHPINLALFLMLPNFLTLVKMCASLTKTITLHWATSTYMTSKCKRVMRDETSFSSLSPAVSEIPKELRER